jgi:ABC-type uncharacterized transport system substrate-binding protein
MSVQINMPSSIIALAHLNARPCRELAILIMFLLFLLSARSEAHPHNWIQLDSTFVLDDQARLIEIKQTWAFDTYYSMMTLADAVNEHGNETVGLKVTAERMILNLAEYKYFSNLRVNGAQITLGKPTSFALTKTSTSDDEFQRPGLELTMAFKVAPSIAIEKQTLQWQVFDPMYYIAMEHSVVNNIQVIGGDATECSTELDIPEPSEEIIKYAMQLDQTQKDTPGLGKHFAETAVIRCF